MLTDEYRALIEYEPRYPMIKSIHAPTSLVADCYYPTIFDAHLDQVVNKSWNFAGRCNSEKDHLLNAVMGLAGEAGELADEHKKAFFHTDRGLEPHRNAVLKELGDVLFYWLKTADLWGFSHQEIIDMNRAKLESRHPELGVVTERFGKDAIR